MRKILSFLLTMIVVIPLHMNAQVAANDSKLPDSVNRKDATGNKTGYWIEKLGELTYKGEYAANKKVKNWIGYYPNNLIYKIEYFENGVKDGISIQFDRKGKMSLVENYRNGLAHGQTIYYSQFNESPLSETEYAYGKKNGLYRQYYDNAKIQEESWFKDNLKNGLSRWNNKNGQRVAEYNYKEGNFDGLQKTFYENDTLQTITNYKDNKMSGEFKEYYRNGQIKVSGSYLNGQKEGTWTEYNELGKAVLVARFKNGVEQFKK
ncbi:MAG: toxin-antitoxin system YwqK family antitoxin [Bacteroidota bacterium]